MGSIEDASGHDHAADQQVNGSGMSQTVRETSYHLACEALRDVLLDAMQRGPDRGIRPVPYRACAALYSLLLDHPVDQRGRCRSCRRPGTVLGLRRRRCLVRVTAGYWLLQPDHAFLLAHLAGELGLDVTQPLGADAAPSTAPAQTPVASPPPSLPGGFPRVGRPVPEHGGAGEHPDDPRSRRRSPEDPPSHPGRSLVVIGAPPCPA